MTNSNHNENGLSLESYPLLCVCVCAYPASIIMPIWWKLARVSCLIWIGVGCCPSGRPPVNMTAAAATSSYLVTCNLRQTELGNTSGRASLRVGSKSSLNILSLGPSELAANHVLWWPVYEVHNSQYGKIQCCFLPQTRIPAQIHHSWVKTCGDSATCSLAIAHICLFLCTNLISLAQSGLAEPELVINGGKSSIHEADFDPDFDFNLNPIGVGSWASTGIIVAISEPKTPFDWRPTVVGDPSNRLIDQAHAKSIDWFEPIESRNRQTLPIANLLAVCKSQSPRWFAAMHHQTSSCPFNPFRGLII